MSRLSQLRSHGGSFTGSVGTHEDQGTITSQAPFQRPISAQTLDNGENVRILATGDIKGMSPAYLVCNENGMSDWVSYGDVKITDEQVVPLSRDQRDRLQSGSRSTR